MSIHHLATSEEIRMKPNVQTARKTILHFQDLVEYTEERERVIMEIKYKKNILCSWLKLL